MTKLLTILLAVFTALFLNVIFISAQRGALERVTGAQAGIETGIVVEDFDYPMDISTQD